MTKIMRVCRNMKYVFIQDEFWRFITKLRNEKWDSILPWLDRFHPPIFLLFYLHCTYYSTIAFSCILSTETHSSRVKSCKRNKSFQATLHLDSTKNFSFSPQTTVLWVFTKKFYTSFFSSFFQLNIEQINLSLNCIHLIKLTYSWS